ncbi:hypothetical protein [Streptomyces sp. AC154]|uniref:hypothetical protein n=1 Tax=Streptomyces sp. AC154 TaxID=3143184 RepID=UPI003F819146
MGAKMAMKLSFGGDWQATVTDAPLHITPRFTGGSVEVVPYMDRAERERFLADTFGSEHWPHRLLHGAVPGPRGQLAGLAARSRRPQQAPGRLYRHRPRRCAPHRDGAVVGWSFAGPARYLASAFTAPGPDRPSSATRRLLTECLDLVTVPLLDDVEGGDPAAVARLRAADEALRTQREDRHRTNVLRGLIATCLKDQGS